MSAIITITLIMCECINIMSYNKVFLMCSNNNWIKILKTWELYDWVLVGSMENEGGKNVVCKCFYS
jgi:hypothetical protein